MKKLLLLAFIMLGIQAHSQVDLVIDFDEKIEDCTVLMTIGDDTIQVQNYRIKKNKIYLYLEMNEEYDLIINCTRRLSIHTDDPDEPRIVYAELSYKYDQGILVLNQGYKF